MKNTYLTYLVIGGLAIAIPALAAPAFVGPSTSPPAGNVEGVIWNLPPGSAAQTANINISGDVKTNNINTNDVNLSNNILTAPTKSLIVTSPTPGAVNDYNIIPQSTFPISGLDLNVQGSLIVSKPSGYAGPAIPGKDGRVQALKFCFDPGNPADCITSWPSGGGGGGTLTGITAGTGVTVSGAAPSPTVSLDTAYANSQYVQKLGDTMTGGLTINLGATYGIDSKGAAAGGIFRNNSNANNVKLGAPGTTLDVSGSAAGNPSAKITEGNLNSNGLEIALPSGSTADGLVIGTNTGYEPNRGVTSYANSVGGHFEGATYGVEARARSAGVGTAVRGYNGDVGGNFTGGTTGVSGSGGTYGVLGSGTYGGVFTGSAGGTVYAGIGASAIYAFTGSPTDYGLYTTGQVYTTANATVGGQLNVNGDMDVPGNQWGAPSSPTFDAKYGSIWPNLGSVITWSTRGNRCGQYSGTVGFGRFFVCPDGTYMAGFHTDGAGRTDNAVCCEL